LACLNGIWGLACDLLHFSSRRNLLILLTPIVAVLLRKLPRARREEVVGAYLLGVSGFTVKEYSPQRHRVRRGFVQVQIGASGDIRFSVG